MTPRGFEPSPDSTGKPAVSESRGNKSGNTGPVPDASTPTPPAAALDPDLAAVVGAWPTLDSAIRAGIVAMVKAATPTPTAIPGGRADAACGRTA